MYPPYQPTIHIATLQGGEAAVLYRVKKMDFKMGPVTGRSDLHQEDIPTMRHTMSTFMRVQGASVGKFLLVFTDLLSLETRVFHPSFPPISPLRSPFRCFFSKSYPNGILKPQGGTALEVQPLRLGILM